MEAKTAYAKSKRSRRRSRGAESGARRLAAALPLRRTAARPTRRMIASRRGTVLRRGAQRSPPRLRIAIAPPGASGAVQDGRRGAIPTFGSDRPRIAPPGASGAVQDGRRGVIPTSGSGRPRLAPPGAAQTDAPRPICRFPADAPRPICRFPADGTPLHLSRSGRCSLRHLPGSGGRPAPHRSFSGGRCCTAYNRRPRASILRAGVSCGNLSQKETTHAPAAPEHAMGVKSETAGTIWLAPSVPASLTPTHFPAACRGGSGAAVSHCSGHASSCQVKS